MSHARQHALGCHKSIFDCCRKMKTLVLEEVICPNAATGACFSIDSSTKMPNSQDTDSELSVEVEDSDTHDVHGPPPPATITPPSPTPDLSQAANAHFARLTFCVEARHPDQQQGPQRPLDPHQTLEPTLQ